MVKQLLPDASWAPPTMRAGTQAYQFADKSVKDRELARMIDTVPDWAHLRHHEAEFAGLSALDGVTKSLKPEMGNSALELCILSQTENAVVIEIPTHTQRDTLRLDLKITPLTATFKRIIVRVGSHARVCIKQLITIQERAFLGSWLTLSLDRFAQVTVLQEYELAPGAYHVEQIDSQLAEQAHLQVRHTVSGQGNFVQEFATRLSEHAQLDYYGLGRTTGLYALTTLQHHTARASVSNVLIKAILGDAVRSFYRGTIKIDEQAQQSSASQYHKVLLLNPGVKNCAIPSLEVKTDEVKCSHGSAASKISPTHLWFFASRGVGIDQATALLIGGFLEENH